MCIHIYMYRYLCFLAKKLHLLKPLDLTKNSNNNIEGCFIFWKADPF